MKKRIGSKLYDTDTAICVIPEKGLYRAQKKQTYFLFDGEKITPIEYEEAAKMITAMWGGDMLKHKAYGRGKNSSIHVSADLVDRLAVYCRRNGVSQKKVIEDFIRSLPAE